MTAPASTSADASEFAISVAFGYGHVLDKALGFLEWTSSELSPVLAVSLALPVLLAYLVVVTLAFAVCVVADSCAYIVLANGNSSSEPAAMLWQAVARTPAAVVKLLTYLVVLGGFAVLVLLRFSSISCPLGFK